MKPDDTELEALARRLEESGDFRVLRRLRHQPLLSRDELPTGAREAVALDLETTGLDHATDLPIELGMVRFAYDDDGRVLGLTGALSGFEDPGRPLTPEIVQLTGISDDDLRGQRFDDEAVAKLLEGVHLVVAHNAAFDRPFAERRWPKLAEVAWACSLRELPWREEGFEGSGQQALLNAHGLYFDGHRAEEDARALVALLALPLRLSGDPAFQRLRQSALRSQVRLWAVGSPFESKDLLRARGYRWNAEGKSWWVDVDEGAVEEEKQWLHDAVYRRRPPELPQVRLDAWSRYSKRVPEVAPA